MKNKQKGGGRVMNLEPQEGFLGDAALKLRLRLDPR